MYKIKYDTETRVFGVQGTRVRKLGNEYVKSKYGEDSNKYKDRMERDAMLDSIEDQYAKKPTSYGYAKTPERVLEQIIQDYKGRYGYEYGNRYDNLRGTDASYKGNTLLDKPSSDYYGYVVNRFNNNFYRDLRKKYGNDNESARGRYDELGKVDTDDSLNPDLRKKVEDAGYEFREDSSPSRFQVDKDGEGFLNSTTNGPKSDSLHEYQHMKNYQSGALPTRYGDFNYLVSANLSPINDDEYVYNDPNSILDYGHNVLQEEQSANRGRVMNHYLMGGDPSKLNTVQDVSNTAQSTYNSMIGGYNPPSDRYEMSPEALKNLKRNKRSK